MIIFKAVTKPVSNILKEHETYAANRITESLAAQLTSRFGERSCFLHPNYQNCIQVDTSQPEDRQLLVEDCCCEDFAKTLLKDYHSHPETKG